MKQWPRTDANLILIFEILLMTAFISMNACDALLVDRQVYGYKVSFANPISSILFPFFFRI